MSASNAGESAGTAAAPEPSGVTTLTSLLSGTGSGVALDESALNSDGGSIEFEVSAVVVKSAEPGGNSASVQNTDRGGSGRSPHCQPEGPCMDATDAGGGVGKFGCATPAETTTFRAGDGP